MNTEKKRSSDVSTNVGVYFQQYLSFCSELIGSLELTATQVTSKVTAQKYFKNVEFFTQWAFEIVDDSLSNVLKNESATQLSTYICCCFGHSYIEKCESENFLDEEKQEDKEVKLCRSGTCLEAPLIPINTHPNQGNCTLILQEQLPLLVEIPRSDEEVESDDAVLAIVNEEREEWVCVNENTPFREQDSRESHVALPNNILHCEDKSNEIDIRKLSFSSTESFVIVSPSNDDDHEELFDCQIEQGLSLERMENFF